MIKAIGIGMLAIPYLLLAAVGNDPVIQVLIAAYAFSAIIFIVRKK